MPRAIQFSSFQFPTQAVQIRKDGRYFCIFGFSISFFKVNFVNFNENLINPWNSFVHGLIHKLLPENEPLEASATTRAVQAIKKTPANTISLLSIRLRRFHHGGFLKEQDERVQNYCRTWKLNSRRRKSKRACKSFNL